MRRRKFDAEAAATLVPLEMQVLHCKTLLNHTESSESMSKSLVNCKLTASPQTTQAGRAGRTRPGKCFRLYTLEAGCLAMIVC